MKGRIAVTVGIITLLAAGFVVGQTTSPLQPYPDILTSQTAASTALLSYKAAVEANIQAVSDAQQADAAAIAKFVDQAATISLLQSQVAAGEARIKALEAAVAALQAKVQTAGNALVTPTL